MDIKILEFLKKNRVSVLSVLLPDGSPHVSTLHYSHQENPLEVYFSTENTSRKCQGLLKREKAKASVVIGFSEEEWLTFQMDGEVSVISDTEELKAAKAIHYPKHPNSQKFENDPATIFLKFTPNWWRFTDYNTTPVTYLSSR